jgi:hypothetical protein
MEHFARFKNQVSASWVKQLISGGKPEHYINDKFAIVHAQKEFLGKPDTSEESYC